MKQAEFFELLKANHLNLPLYQASNRRVSADRARIDGITPKLYDRKNVFGLIDDFQDCCRFVIDAEQNPVFGDIGKVSGRTPGHEEMSNGLCLTAGVLFFKEKKLIGMSHESGYFKAELESLLWALKAFILDQDRIFDVAEALRIDHFNKFTNDWERLEISTSVLESELRDLTITASDQLVSTFSSEPNQQMVSGAKGRSDSFDAMVSVSAHQENLPAQLLHSHISSPTIASVMVHFGSPIMPSSSSKRSRVEAGLSSNPNGEADDDDVDYRKSGHESPVFGL